MTVLREDDIRACFNERNKLEAARRAAQWSELTAQEREAEPFELFLQRYGLLTHMGDCATLAEIDAVEACAGMALPAELCEFYQRIGKLESGGPHGPVDILSARGLLQRLDPAGAMPAHARLRSLGLLDFVNLVWGNNRFELDPANGCIDASLVEQINAKCRGIGWVWVEPGLEAHEFIYFDTEGCFGTVFYHQDDFDSFVEDELLPLLERRPESRTLSDILIAARCQVSDDDQWDDL